MRLRLYGDNGKENGSYRNGLHRVQILGFRVHHLWGRGGGGCGCEV